MDVLDLSKCTTNEEVCTLISKRVNLLSFDNLMKKVNKEFVFQEDATRAIYTGLIMNMNVFLSGPGGYGKSTLIKHVLDIYKIPYHTIIGYKDMPVDALLGIPNMDKLLKDSEYEIKFEKSVFCKPGVLIGEEFTDILPATAAVLKDILSERGYRSKNKKVENLISIMIIAANKNSSEIVDDESKKALYDERFPIKADVNWSSYGANAYFMLLKTAFKHEHEDKLYFMAKLFSKNHEEHINTITPRTAINITKAYLRQGLSFINSFNINLSSIDNIKREAAIEFEKKKNELTLSKVEEYIMSIENEVVRKQALLLALYKLNEIKIDDNMVVTVLEIKSKLADILARMVNGEELTHIIKLFDNYDNKMSPTINTE